MIPVALGLGLVAMKAGRQWLDRQVGERLREAALNAPADAVRPEPTFGTLVVANTRLRFGMNIAPNLLREIPWPDGQAPQGSFAHVADLASQDGKRFVLSGMEPGEPILASKITGPGQRADLAATLEPGMKAVTFRVDEAAGVAGFVLPGDHVDVLLTRIVDRGNAFTDVIMRNVKVLAIDQLNDDRADKPTVARTATVEVAIADAQRLIVAQNVGAMSLVLRPVGAGAEERDQRITAADLLGHAGGDMPVSSFKSNITVGVVRGAQRTEYAVPPAPVR